MDLQLKNLHNWFIARNQRERFILLIIFLSLLYLSWYFVLAESLWQNQNNLALNIETAQQKLSTIKAQINIYTDNSDNPQLLQEHQQLVRQLKQLDHMLNQNKQSILSAEQQLLALKALLNSSQELTLLDFTNLTPGPEQKLAFNLTNQAYQHDILLKFNGSYFAVLRYLQQLDELPWRFYWDGLDYKVSNYPAAQITLKLHILSTEENLSNA